jgi:hypothetical protein
MTRDEAVTRIQRRLGFRTDLVAEIQDELKVAQESLEREMVSPPWFLLEEVSFTVTTADESRVEVPSNFLREYEQGTLWIYDTALEDPWVELSKGFMAGLNAFYVGTGQPKAFSLDGKYFRLHPTPDAEYTLRLIYYKTDTPLTTNIENQWLKYAPWLLVGLAGQEVAVGTRDGDAVAYFKARYEQSKVDVHRQNIARSITRKRMVRED